MIYAAHDDPAWVHEFLEVLMEKKIAWIEAAKGARYDLVELGGGDASDTVISPAMFEEFVLPSDAKVVQSLHDAGFKTVYHTCGGMMHCSAMVSQVDWCLENTMLAAEMVR